MVRLLRFGSFARLVATISPLAFGLAACSDGDGGGSRDGSGGSGGAGGETTTVGTGPTSGLGATDPITVQEILDGLAGDIDFIDGTMRHRGCVLDAPEIGEHVLYVARTALPDGEIHREVVLALDEPVAIDVDAGSFVSVEAHFFELAPAAGPRSCDAVLAAVKAAPPSERVGCLSTFRRERGDDVITGRRAAVEVTQEDPDGERCFPQASPDLQFFGWEVGETSVTWAEEDTHDQGGEWLTFDRATRE